MVYKLIHDKMYVVCSEFDVCDVNVQNYCLILILIYHNEIKQRKPN